MSSYIDLQAAITSFETTNESLTQSAANAVTRAETAANDAETAAKSAQKIATGEIIDDTVSSPNMLWSSAKVQAEIGDISSILDTINGVT